MDIFSFQIKHLSPVLFLFFSKGTFLILRIVGMNFHFLFQKVLHFTLNSSPANYFKCPILYFACTLLKQLLLKSPVTPHCQVFSLSLVKSLFSTINSFLFKLYGCCTLLPLPALTIPYQFLFFLILENQLTPRVASLALFPFYP